MWILLEILVDRIIMHAERKYDDAYLVTVPYVKERED